MRAAALRGASLTLFLTAAPTLSQRLPGIGSGTGGEDAADAEPKLDIEPILPADGLLDRETWIGLGRRIVEKAIEAIPSLITAVLVLLVFWILSRIVVRLMKGVLGRSRVEPALTQITLPLVRYTILALGVIMAASQAGLEVGSLLAGVGIAGLAIGLAAQDSLANIVAGFTILWDRPFRIGDKVTITGIYGQVMQIGLRSTRLRTLEQLDIVLPNKEVINHTITNHTQTPDLRLPIPLSIAYKEDTEGARRALLAAVEGHDRVRSQPPPEVVVTALADSGVNLELRVWVEDPQEERKALFEILELAKRALDEAGIEIPFPQRMLHFHPDSSPLPVDEQLAPSEVRDDESTS